MPIRFVNKRFFYSFFLLLLVFGLWRISLFSQRFHREQFSRICSFWPFLPPSSSSTWISFTFFHRFVFACHVRTGKNGQRTSLLLWFVYAIFFLQFVFEIHHECDSCFFGASGSSSRLRRRNLSKPISIFSATGKPNKLEIWPIFDVLVFSSLIQLPTEITC